MSAAVQTATTPGSARAADVSIATILPWAWFERTIRMWSWCGNEMSAAKRPRPLTSGGSSSRSTDCPIHLLLSAVIGPRPSWTPPWRCGRRGGVRRWRACPRSCRRLFKRAARDGAREIATVGRASVGVLEWIDRGCHRRGRRLEGRTVGRAPRESLLGLHNPARLRLDPTHRHPRLADHALLYAKRHQRHGKREITRAAIELVEAETRVGGKDRQPHFG